MLSSEPKVVWLNCFQPLQWLRKFSGPIFYLFARPLLAGRCRHPRLEGEVLCRTLHTPPRPSHRGVSAALPDALRWEHSGSWTTRTNMAAGTTSAQWLGDFLITTMSDMNSSDPVSFFVIKYLWVDSVQLQHQLIDQLGVHPLIWAQEVGVHLQTFMVAVKIWSKTGKRKCSDYAHFNSTLLDLKVVRDPEQLHHDTSHLQ